MSREFIFTTLQRQLQTQEISELQLAIQVSLCLAARTWLPGFLQSQMRTAA